MLSRLPSPPLFSKMPPPSPNVGTTNTTNLPSLVLHFDVNETIIVEDIAGGDTRDMSLNKALTKSLLVSTAGGSLDEEGVPAEYFDGSKIEGATEPAVEDSTTPPFFNQFNRPNQTESYYRTPPFRRNVWEFDEHSHCLRFLEVRRQMVEALACPNDWPQPLQSPSTPGSLFIVPSFFEALHQLTHVQSRSATVVIRTFGSDLAAVREALAAFGRGEHPEYPDYRCAAMENLVEHRGRYDEDGVFFLYDGEGRKVAETEGELLEFIEGGECLVVQDDYEVRREQRGRGGARRTTEGWEEGRRSRGRRGGEGRGESGPGGGERNVRAVLACAVFEQYFLPLFFRSSVRSSPTNISPLLPPFLPSSLFSLLHLHSFPPFLSLLSSHLLQAWRDADYSPSSGKPTWISDKRHHIFFDDVSFSFPFNHQTAAEESGREGDEGSVRDDGPREKLPSKRCDLPSALR